jgi:hypothetical protein
VLSNNLRFSAAPSCGSKADPEALRGANPGARGLPRDPETQLTSSTTDPPRRMQSLPRSHRATKGPERGRELRQIEGLARTNFQRIGYLSLSRGNTNSLNDNAIRTPIKSCKEVKTDLTPDRRLHFVKDEYITRVLALGNEHFLLGNQPKGRVGVTDERPLHYRRVYDKYKVAVQE